MKLCRLFKKRSGDFSRSLRIPADLIKPNADLYKSRIAEKVFYIVIAKQRRSCANLSSDDFEITTSFYFRKTSRDNIEI